MPPKRKANKNVGYRMADLIVEGTVVTDAFKKDWKVGPSIGKGGFGLIYLTHPNSPSAVPTNAEYVMKMEPIENGPLFCEVSCVQRAITHKKVSEYMKKRKISFLGVPKFHCMGTHKHKEAMYRFLVMERMDRDLDAIIASSPSHTLPPNSAFHIASQVIDCLEYLHSEGYAHADIKAGNLMTGQKNDNQIYLIDYGLATRFSVNGKHKEYAEDKKLAHNGTCIFTSRDAHRGAYPSARGDLEILGYCMWHWLEGRLPWEDKVDDPVSVAAQKESYMMDIAKIDIQDSEASKILSKYMSKVRDLPYDQPPDYSSFRDLLKTKPPKNLLSSAPSKTKSSTSKTIKKPSTPKRTPKPSTSKSRPPKSPPVKSSASSARSTTQANSSPSEEGRSGPSRGSSKARGRGAVKAVSGGEGGAKEVVNAYVSSPRRTSKRVVSTPGKKAAGGRDGGKVVDGAGISASKLTHPRQVRKVKLELRSQGVQTSPGLLGLSKKIKLS